jgi:hypothetical protein
MTNMVRDTFHSIGDRSGDIARTLGSGTADIARRFGDGTADIARRIGPRRAIIGLALAAIAIGGSVVVIRYLRSRRAQNDVNLDRDEEASLGSRTNERTRSPGVEGRVSY